MREVRGQPGSQVGGRPGRAASVELVNQALAVLVVPEADGSELPCPDRDGGRAHHDLLGLVVEVAGVGVIAGGVGEAGVPLVGTGRAAAGQRVAGGCRVVAVAVDGHRLGVHGRPVRRHQRERDRSYRIIAARELGRVLDHHGRGAQRHGGGTGGGADGGIGRADGLGLVLAVVGGSRVFGVAAVSGGPEVGAGGGGQVSAGVVAGGGGVGAVAGDG